MDLSCIVLEKEGRKRNRERGKEKRRRLGDDCRGEQYSRIGGIMGCVHTISYIAFSPTVSVRSQTRMSVRLHRALGKDDWMSDMSSVYL